jgi:hypothetical protein
MSTPVPGSNATKPDSSGDQKAGWFQVVLRKGSSEAKIAGGDSVYSREWYHPGRRCNRLRSLDFIF